MSNKPGDWWTDSWGVVSGCTPVGAGCDNCWASALVKRFPVAHDPRSCPDDGECEQCRWFAACEDAAGDGLGLEHRPFSRVLCHHDRLDAPLRARKPRVYAVSLLGDLFHEEVPLSHIRGVCNRLVERHRFVLLTKRWGRAAMVCPAMLEGLDNIILLASVWDQESTDAACAAFAGLPIRWGLHMEPLVGEVDLLRYLSSAQIACRCGHAFEAALAERCHCHPPDDWTLSCPACAKCVRQNRRVVGCDWKPLPSWIVVGGETGPKARPMHPDWVRQIRDQCKAAGVPFWFKGWGKFVHVEQMTDECYGRVDTVHNLAGHGQEMWGVGKKLAGRLLDGVEHNEVPW